MHVRVARIGIQNIDCDMKVRHAVYMFTSLVWYTAYSIQHIVHMPHVARPAHNMVHMYHVTINLRIHLNSSYFATNFKSCPWCKK